MSRLSILLIKDCDKWTAQCLEHDISAQGETIGKAMFEFQRTLVAEIVYNSANGSGLACIAAAPKYYWNKFQSVAEKLEEGKIPPFMPGEVPSDITIPQYGDLRVA